MKLEELMKDNDLSDDKYYCYHPIIQVQIFNCLIDADTVKECEINIARDCNISEMLPLINEYLNWLKECDKELTSYFGNKLTTIIPEKWFESIEVYRFSITFNSADDYGATISCGESLFNDHIIDFEFEEFQIIDDRLNG